MANPLKVSPTQGNLLRLEARAAEVRSRRDLLDRKREVLVRELLGRLDEATELEEQMRDLFRKAHEGMALARMRVGSDRMEWVVLSPGARAEVQLGTRTIMGARLPRVELTAEPIQPPYAFVGTSAALDEARARWLDVLRFLGEASEVMSSVWKLAAELRKTKRQVNAIDSILIPRIRATIRQIEDRLEEGEREDILHAQKVKEAQER